MVGAQASDLQREGRFTANSLFSAEKRLDAQVRTLAPSESVRTPRDAVLSGDDRAPPWVARADCESDGLCGHVAGGGGGGEHGAARAGAVVPWLPLRHFGRSRVFEKT